MIHTKALPMVMSLLAASLLTNASEPLRFIPATPDNTTFADGTAFSTRENEWKWLPVEGNGGIFESAGDPAKNAPTLLIHAKDLEPGRDYEVFGFFWAHGFGSAPASRGKQPHHWPARFGTGLATLTTFGGRMSQDIPWVISPESKTGIRSGYTVALEEKSPVVKDVSKWITAVDDTRLIRARLGISRADKQGNIPVIADDFPHSKFTGLTRRGAYALIDKSTGKATTLIKGITIDTFNGYPRHQSACVEVVDDEFYMLVHGGQGYHFPLTFNFPDEYVDKALFIDAALIKSHKMLPVKIFTVKQLQEQKRLHPIMIGQTGTHLIIGLRIPLVCSKERFVQTSRDPGHEMNSSREPEPFRPFPL